MEQQQISAKKLKAMEKVKRANGERIAKEISTRMKTELGVTVSIGVSFNKIYAKLGSDYKKPDAITTMYRHEIREKAWGLPASDLLYVGRSNAATLQKLGIRTIGELAGCDEALLRSRLGKMGSILWAFANGYDDSPVKVENAHAPTKHADGCGQSYEWTRPQVDVKEKDVVFGDTLNLMLSLQIIFDRFTITDFEFEKQMDGKINETTKVAVVVQEVSEHKNYTLREESTNQEFQYKLSKKYTVGESLNGYYDGKHFLTEKQAKHRGIIPVLIWAVPLCIVIRFLFWKFLLAFIRACLKG